MNEISWPGGSGHRAARDVSMECVRKLDACQRLWSHLDVTSAQRNEEPSFPSKRHLLEESRLSWTLSRFPSLFLSISLSLPRPSPPTLSLSLSPVYQPANLFTRPQSKGGTAALSGSFFFVKFLRAGGDFWLMQPVLVFLSLCLHTQCTHTHTHRSLRLCWKDLPRVCVCVFEYVCAVQLCGSEEVLWSTYDWVPCDGARIGLIFSSLSAVAGLCSPCCASGSQQVESASEQIFLFAFYNLIFPPFSSRWAPQHHLSPIIFFWLISTSCSWVYELDHVSCAWANSLPGTRWGWNTFHISVDSAGASRDVANFPYMAWMKCRCGLGWGVCLSSLVFFFILRFGKIFHGLQWSSVITQEWHDTQLSCVK